MSLAPAGAVVTANTVTATPYPLVTPNDWEIEAPFNATFYVSPQPLSKYRIETYLVAQGFAYFFVTPGQAIVPSAVDINTALVTNYPRPTSPVGNLFTVLPGAPLLLGYWRDANFAPSPIEGDDFGWVELGNVGGVLTVLRSATASSSPGIYAGTLIEVPEPSVAVLAGAVLGFAGLRRRRSAGESRP